MASFNLFSKLFFSLQFALQLKPLHNYTLWLRVSKLDTFN